MIKLIKNILIGTPLEFPIRRLYQDLLWRFSKPIRYDYETRLIMRRVLKKDSNCIDVGCYHGAILREILRFAPNGVHYAFEPVPELYQKLASQFPNVKIFNLALSDTYGKATFYDVVSCQALSGFKKRNLQQKETISQIMVQIDTLDRVIPHNIPIDFIKIDVEGAELLVLTGAINTICRNKPVIVFEYGTSGVKYFGASPKKIYDLLTKECGLHISPMKNWLSNKPPLSRQEFADQIYAHLDYYFMAYK